MQWGLSRASGPGNTYVPSWPVSFLLVLVTAPNSQPPPTIMAAWPSARTVSWSGALVLTSREAGTERKFWTVSHSLRPARQRRQLADPLARRSRMAIWPP